MSEQFTPGQPVPLWVVELVGPRGKKHHLEVPTYQGQQAAERRALVTAWAVGIGDVDEVAVNDSWLDERAPYVPGAEALDVPGTQALDEPGTETVR